jgi:hypothetical protein
MWVRIFWITAGSSMQAMICSAAPQAGQGSMSTPALQQTNHEPGVSDRCGP